MRWHAAVVAGLACWGLGGATAARAWEIPLTVENAWRRTVPPFVSGGVPLLAGQAKDPSDLRLVVKDASGKTTAIPAQFRVLARWWRGDDSIRWVLVDFPTAVIPGEKKVVYLTDANVEPPPPTLKVEERDDAFIVDTGAARFTVNRKRFNVLDRVEVEGVEMLQGSPDLGLVVEDTFGEKYYGADGTKSVEISDRGPVRIGIRARGRHLARDGKGYSRGMYGYDVTLNFHAGSSDVTADVVVGNNGQTSIGSPTIEDASLLLRLASGGQPVSGNCHVYGQAPFRSELYKPEDGESICLYQDSNGAETWAECQGFTGDSPGGTSFQGKTVSFRGYRILRRGVGPEKKEEVAGAGDHARGLLLLTTGRGGAVIFVRNFWQQFPLALEGNRDGTVRLGMFPRECRVPHYLEDGSAKGQEIVLHFYANRKSQYPADDHGRTWPHVLADAWDPPAIPRPSAEHIAATGALCDLGPCTVPARDYADYDTAMQSRRLFMTDPYRGNGYGWQIYGERWDSHGGHSTHGARQPIKEDYYLYRYYLTGGTGWLAAGINRSRNFRDVRAYRIEDQDPLAFADWNAFRQANIREDGWCKRPQPEDEELRKYQQGFWRRAPFDYPNPEHTTLDLLYDRYLLFGDQRALENMRVAAANGGFYAIQEAPTIIRQTGWSWRTIERYWELTGDKQARALLDRVIAAYTPLIGKAPLVAPIKDPDPTDYRSWHTMIWNRALAMTALHTGDPQAIKLLETAAQGQEAKADYFCTMFAVLYHLTGEQKYKDAVLAASNGGRKIDVVTDVDDPGWSHMGHMFPCSALWLLQQPPRKP